MNGSNSLLDRLARSVHNSPASALPLRLPNRLLYAVNHCYPFSSNGYAVRTHGIASALVRAGMQVVAASRPGMPWDLPKGQFRGFACHHTIDGVRYLHRPAPSMHGGALEDYLVACADAWAELIQIFKPSTMMAASNWHTALPAAIAAHESGTPFFYEVRGFWEISRTAHEPQWLDTVEYQQEVVCETQIANCARKVFTLNRFMRDELVRRKVDAAKVELVPNGFHRQQTAQTHLLSRQAEGINSRYVVGYIGSFNMYEGLDLLVHALALLRQRGVDVAVLLVGSSESTGLGAGQGFSCPTSQRLRALSNKLGVADYLFMPGRVSPELAMSYYTLLDVVVIPRLPFPVCEIVSPMKPLEAAAYGKYVLMSDVKPLAELAKLHNNFQCFTKGDAGSLAVRLDELLKKSNSFQPSLADLDALRWEHAVQPMIQTMRSQPMSARAFNP